MKYEEYLTKRAELEAENANLVGNVLNEDETALDALLTELKAELIADVGEERAYKMNCLGDASLRESRLYSFIRALPKGSDLHVHATALIPAHRLIDFASTRHELLVDTADCHIYNENEPCDRERCRPLAELFASGKLTKDEVISKWTLLGRRHNESVWDYFENLLCLFESIEYDGETLYEYYRYAFRYYLENGIFHIEIHALFSDDYARSVELANTVKRAYFDERREHPELSVSIICAGLKYIGVDESVPAAYLANALRLRDEVTDDYDKNDVHPFIIGFDLLNEEDKSIPLKSLAPLLLDLGEKHPDFKLYIHCGESLMAQSDNLIDAYLFGASRVGHGMNLYRYPSLLEKYREGEICLEACPISNKTLRYVKDLRLHPVAEYLKRGVTVALCSDDPVCQEHETLTDDFFAGTVCWDMSIADIKQLCINSILYSGLDKAQKSKLISDWRQAWARFIRESGISG